MAVPVYTASKSRTQNRPGWSVTFRHPLRHDARGKPGLKMRRGLGTSDEAEADRMVAELNEILGDSAWWSASKRHEAAGRFAAQVVAAFFDEIQAGREDSVTIREGVIPLPGKDDGYSRVMFVGTTGAGKTSLLRQIIGSDPDEDRFPSTAPAKTTISDIEVVQADGEFLAAVTFFSEFQVQASIEECVSDACMAVLDGASDEKVADRLLSHKDQKFRLSYLLGAWRRADAAEDDEDDWTFSEGDEGPVLAEDDGIPEAERQRNLAQVESFLDRLRNLTIKAAGELSKELGEEVGKLSGDDKDAALELFEERLYVDPGFSELVHDILEEVRGKFDFLTAGDLSLGRSGWPQSWTYRTESRGDFIREIRWFSSNYWPQFGRLLTPLVNGIRIRGPLYLTFAQEAPKLVLIDGQGLGHTPDSSTSVTTHITRRFGDVDVILLVDNAQQPMQAAPLAVLRYVASSGHHGKLAIAFSHFDQIKGASLKTPADRRHHVMASVVNALSSLRDDLGAPVINAIERSIDGRCFMLGGVDRAIDKLPAKAAEYMKGELGLMLGFFAKAIVPPPPPEACPIYDPTGLGFAVREAVGKFMGPWLARLGLGSYDRVHREHWTRIKALNRRIAGDLNVEYDTLRPVADLVARSSEAISRFLDNPIAWTREPGDEEEQQEAIARIRQAVAKSLHDMARHRLIDKPLDEWRKANAERGPGSTVRRNHSIRSIYEAEVPMPDTVMPTATVEFLAEVRGIVEAAIKENGGQLRLA